MQRYEDPNDEGNSEKYLSGKKCYYCNEPAGTAWSPYFCYSCNVERMQRIDKSFERLSKDFKINE